MDETTERVDATPEEPLPNGGAYAIVLYYDADGSAAPKSEAMKAEITEYTADDRPIAITFFDLMGDEDG